MTNRMVGMLLAIALAFAVGCSKNGPRTEFDGGRIVSMTPSMTETLFALELGKNVVGVSRFCAYPAEVKDIAKVGGLMDPDLEAIVRLSPTCVVMQQNSTDIGSKLEDIGIPVKYVKANTLAEVLDSFENVGRTFGRKRQGLELRKSVETALDRGADYPHRKVLLVIWRNVGNGIKDMTIAAQDGYYSEIFRRFNCELMPEKSSVPYPTISAEGVLALKPDMIIELLTGLDEKSQEAAMEDWRRSIPELKADVRIITDQCAVVPGPRIVDFAEIIEKVLSN
ncbi:MAG: ABC transporter substrate-binding protein [Victivallales bacterium]|nr:ABC transporter substrate-binding protein [Victivallales bacterium]